MVVISSTVLFTWLLLACETTTAPQAEDLIHAREKNEHLGRRAVTLPNDGVHTLPTPSPTKPLTIISVPIGGPVTVTAQRQMVQSYVPLMIVCPLDVSPTSLSGPLISDPLTAAPNRTDSNSTIGAALPPAPAIPAGAKHLLPRPKVWDCSTSYASFLTPVCATTLSPLAAPLIPVTACDQNVTFSSEYGYSLSPFTEPPALNPSMVRRQEESGNEIAPSELL